MEANLARAAVPIALALAACTVGRGRDAARFSKSTAAPATFASRGPRCKLDAASPSPAVSAGGSLALSPSEDLAAAVDTDNDRVVLLGLDHGAVTSERAIAVGHRPMQAAFGSGGRLFVTERGDHAASVYDLRTGERLCRADAGADPVGIALTPDQLTLVVTSGIDHRLLAIDTETFATRYVVSVPREPRGVAVTPDGTRAFVAHVAGEPLSMVDLTPGAVRRAIAIPHPPILGDDFEPDLRPPFEPRSAGLELTPGADVERVVATFGDAPLDVAQRRPVTRPFASQAWSVAIDGAGERVVVPFMLSRTGNNTLFDSGEGFEASDEYGGGTRSFNDEKVTFTLGVFNVKTLAWESTVRPFVSNEQGRPVRIPSGVALGPDGAVYVTSMGTDVVARLDEASATVATTSRTVGAPCGVAALRSGVVLVFSQFEHDLQIDRRFDAALTSGSATASATAVPAAAANAPETEHVSLGADAIEPAIARGRRLFHAAENPAISTGGFACAGCHPDGRDDGLVWFLPAGARQTPMLAGRLEHPFNWNGTHETLEANIAQTVQRLGGTGLTPDEVAALAAYIARALPVPQRSEGALTPQQARGRELFEGEAACDGCHMPGRNFTDGAAHHLPGSRFPETLRQFDTPSLAFVGGTAPYFHDGRYATLRALLASRRHQMGRAWALAPADVDALDAYLQTL